MEVADVRQLLIAEGWLGREFIEIRPHRGIYYQVICRRGAHWIIARGQVRLKTWCAAVTMAAKLERL